VFVMGNPVYFVDPSGLTAFTVRNRGARANTGPGRYTLFVRTRGTDNFVHYTGAIGILISGITWGLSYRSISNQWTPVEVALDLLGYVPYMSFPAMVGGVLQRHVANNHWRVQEAVYNHFGAGIFSADTREEVELRFRFATSNMAALYNAGHIQIMTGEERFGRAAFQNSHFVQAIDPLGFGTTIRAFTRNNLYFFLTNSDDTTLHGRIFEMQLAIVSRNP